MRRSRIIALISGAMFLLLALLVVLLFSIDLGRFKHRVEPMVSDILGREFTIDGPLHLNLGSRIELSAEKVRLAGTPWSSEPQLASIERLEATVELRSLFSGPVMIERLRVDGIRLNLEENEAGNNNWTFLEKSTDQGDQEKQKERFSLPVMASDVRITDSILQFDSPNRSGPGRLALDSVTQDIAGNDKFELAVLGNLNGTGLGLKASTHGLESLVELLDVRFDLSGYLGEITFEGNFHFTDLLNPSRPTGELALVGPNMEYLLDRLRVERFTSGPLNLSLSIAPRKEKLLLQLEGVFGEFGLSSRGSFIDLQQLEDIDLEFNAGGPDIGRVAQFAGVEHVPNDPFTIAGALHRSGDDIKIDDIAVSIGDSRFNLAGDFKNFPDPNSAQFELHLMIPDIAHFSPLLRLPGKLAGPLRMDGKLAPMPEQDGAAVNVMADTNDLNLVVTGNILDTPDFTGSELRLGFNGPLLSTVTGALGVESGPEAPFAVDVLFERFSGGAHIKDGRITLGDNAEYALSLDGMVTEQSGLLGSHIRLSGQGPDLSELSAALGIDIKPDLPFTVSAAVSIADKGYEIERATVDIGQDRATVAGLVGKDPLASDTDVEFSLELPDLKQSIAAFGVSADSVPAGNLQASGSVSTDSGKIHLQDIAISLADTTANVQGEISGLSDLDGSALQLEVAGSNLSQLLPPGEGLENLRKPFTLSAGIKMAQQSLRIESARFTIDQTSLTANADFKLDPLLESGQISLQGKSPDLLPFFPEVAELTSRNKAPLDLLVEGHWANKLLTVEQLLVKLAAGTLQVKGKINGPPDFDQTDLRLTGEFKSLAPLSKAAGRQLPDIPGNLTFHLVGKGDVMEFKTFEGRVGDSDFNGDFTLRSGEIPDVSLTLNSRRLDLRPFLPPPVVARTDEPVETAPPKDKNRRVIPDTPIPMDELTKLRVRLNVHVDEINLREENLRNAVIVASIQEGAFVVDEAGFKGGRNGVFSASLSLRPGIAGPELGARINGSNLTVGLPASSTEELEALPHYELNLGLTGRGRTIREIAGGTNGYLRVVVGEGRLRASASRLLTNDFIYQLVNVVNPFAVKDPNTELNCAVVLAAIEGGQLEGKPILVLQSGRVNIFADLDIDLQTEKLVTKFNTVPQKGLGVSLSDLVSPYVAVTGTLANPQISLDAESTVVEGGVAAVTLGLSILAKGVKDRFFSSKTPCVDELKLADEDLKILEARYARQEGAQ